MRCGRPSKKSSNLPKSPSLRIRSGVRDRLPRPLSSPGGLSALNFAKHRRPVRAGSDGEHQTEDRGDAKADHGALADREPEAIPAPREQHRRHAPDEQLQWRVEHGMTSSPVTPDTCLESNPVKPPRGGHRSRGRRESFDVWLEVSTGLVKLIRQAGA
jgi:hypothetical protein